jgi:oxygen-independent coproporphyrinogen-3 oxidase
MGPVLLHRKSVTGLYLHVPYCTVRCSYCDFYLVPAARGRDLEPFAAALTAEIAAAGRRQPGCAADTIHFGGGTPSRLGAGTLARLLTALRAAFEVAPGAEIAIEANPEDLDRSGAAALVEAGFDRVALGIQTFDDALLRMLRRPHDAATAADAIDAARGAGFRSVAADLILGLPGQDEARALADAARLADAGVDHVSLYLLETHDRTRLGREVSLGRRILPDADRVADLYEGAADLLEGRGFEHYEISNFSRPGHRSRHNLKYWTDEDYLGFGPAAHSRRGTRRWANAADLAAYLSSGGAPVIISDDRSAAMRGLEALITGLRLLEGVDLLNLAARHDAGIPAPADPLLGLLAADGLVAIDGARLRLTRRGRLVSNEIFERLLPEAGAGDPDPGRQFT